MHNTHTHLLPIFICIYCKSGGVEGVDILDYRNGKFCSSPPLLPGTSFGGGGEKIKRVSNYCLSKYCLTNCNRP